MAKKVWISFPLTTEADSKDAAVVNFVKGGLKRALELETATLATRWLLEKEVPFRVDFESCSVDRAQVIAALPKRLQKAFPAEALVEPKEAEPTPTTVESVEAAGGEAQAPAATATVAENADAAPDAEAAPEPPSEAN